MGPGSQPQLSIFNSGLIGWLVLPHPGSPRLLRDWLAGAASQPGLRDAACEPGHGDVEKVLVCLE